jgi:hypothetical protein
MKPLNIISVPPGFWVLRDERGLFYAYSSPESGVRCTDEMRLARKYGTERGAWSAHHKIRLAYGKQTQPIYFTTRLTYHETQAVPG